MRRWRYLPYSMAILALVLAACASGNNASGEPAAITGVLFYDVDGDGVRDEGEPGVPGRGIDLSWAEIGFAQTSTGREGTFRFVDLARGDYLLLPTIEPSLGGACGGVGPDYSPFPNHFCFVPEHPWRVTTHSSDAIELGLRGGETNEVSIGIQPLDVAIIEGGAIFNDSRAVEGVLIEALVAGQTCGTTTTTDLVPDPNFKLEILGVDERDGCARPGDVVRFRVGGTVADETLTWTAFTRDASKTESRYQLQNLSAMQEYAWYWYVTSQKPLPADGAPVAAVIDGQVCGETTILLGRGATDGEAGFSRLIVPSEEIQSGCGRSGATVNILVNGEELVNLPWQTGVQRIEP